MSGQDAVTTRGISSNDKTGKGAFTGTGMLFQRNLLSVDETIDTSSLSAKVTGMRVVRYWIGWGIPVSPISSTAAVARAKPTLQGCGSVRSSSPKLPEGGWG